jgi:hypothetical protein
VAEETVLETAVEDSTETQPAGSAAEEAEESSAPSPFVFAGFLLGSWLALMIIFVVFAAVAMSIVGGMMG